MRSQSALSCELSAVFLLVLTCLLCLVTTETTTYYHDYIVIGAGPGGLQMGYFLQSAGRDYLIVERGDVSGYFFTQYPRHDKLISINKRHTGKSNKEFNLRHDWNSLISDDDSLEMRHYSREFFPHRKQYLEYLHDYQHKLGIQVRHNTLATDIHRLQREDGETNFTFKDQHGNIFNCRTLLVATGLSKPSIPEFQGSEYVEGYEDVSVDPEDFEGQTVLILGRGNSAFEVADRIYGSTNMIHMIGRSRVRLSWATHYVGDLRAVNNNLLDTYQLKSLDGVLEAPMEEVKIIKMGEKLYLDLAITNRNEGRGEVFDNFALRESYDRVIRCLGFMFDDAIFSNDTRVSRGENRATKFPLIGQDYQSADLPGMYYVGTVTHSLDHRKSSGGFIHGFRYTVRTLHRMLEWRNHGVPWPSTTGPISQLLPTILKRINEASGPYQMFGVLGDVIAFRNDHQTFELFEEFPVGLLHEFHKHSGQQVDDVIVILLQYGADFSGPEKDIFRLHRATGEPSEAHNSNFLHPVFYHYKSLPTYEDMQMKGRKAHLPRPDHIHHIVEDFLTVWDAPTNHILPLRYFLENILNQDLRYAFADSCFQMALLQQTFPHMCNENFLSGQGLFKAPNLLVPDVDPFDKFPQISVVAWLNPPNDPKPANCSTNIPFGMNVV